MKSGGKALRERGFRACWPRGAHYNVRGYREGLCVGHNLKRRKNDQREGDEWDDLINALLAGNKHPSSWLREARCGSPRGFAMEERMGPFPGRRRYPMVRPPPGDREGRQPAKPINSDAFMAGAPRSFQSPPDYGIEFSADQAKHKNVFDSRAAQKRAATLVGRSAAAPSGAHRSKMARRSFSNTTV